MSRKLYKSLKAQKDQTEQVKLVIYGSLGIPLGGRKIIQVDGRQGYVYVRLRDNQNEVIQAFNNKVAASYDLPVILVREGGRYVVQQFNSQRYLNNAQNSAPFLPGHGTQHSFPRGGGADITWVYGQQIIPGLVYPESATGTNVMIEKYPLYSSSGRWIYAGGTGTQNILQYRPTTGSSSLMTLVYLDSITGNPGILIGSGTYFPAVITGSVYPYLPSPSNTQIPLAGVLLNTGTTVITWENIYDVRQWVHATPSGTSSGGGVTSVNGYTGVVVLTPADIGAEPTFTIADRSAATAWATGTAYVYGDDVYVDNTSVITYYTCIVPHTSSATIFLDNTKWLYRAANYLVVSDSAYNSALWDGITDIAPSKNAVRDKFVSIDAAIAGQLQGIVGQNKGIPLGTGTVLNINGSRLIGSISGTVLNLTNSPDPYDNIGIYGMSGTSGLGTGTSVSFGYGLNPSITGTTLYVSSAAIAETNSNDVYRVDNPGGASLWAGTISGAPSGVSVTVSAPSSGTEAVLVPTSTSQLAKMRLYNTTRGNYALISNYNTGTNVVTLTATVPANWASGDSLTTASQTVSGGGLNWIDLEITSSTLMGKASIFGNVQIISATAGDIVRIHPFTTFAISSIFPVAAPATNIQINSLVLIKVISNVFTICWSGTPVTVYVREAGYLG